MGSSGAPAGENFGTFGTWNFDGAYLAGMLAGKMTKSNIVGSVGAMPIPEVNMLINAFAAGVKAVNPQAKHLVTFIGTFFDPPKAREAGLAQIDAGADILFGERIGTADAAKERGIKAVGSLIDYTPRYPDTVFANALWNFRPILDAALADVAAGKPVGRDYTAYGLMKEGGSDIVFVKGTSPADVEAAMEERRADIKAGRFEVPQIKGRADVKKAMGEDAIALAQAISAGKLTARGAMEAAIIAAENDSHGAIVFTAFELGRASVDRIDAMRCDVAPGAAMPFAGVPTLAKDLGGPFEMLPVAAGSRIFARVNASSDSDIARRFRAAGLCPFGLTTSPEFGLSLASEPAAGPVCRNPLAPHLSAGGSSGGAAAAVASGIVAIAHATDAGGSIRVPAAACGLVGLKPGRGSVPGGPSYENHIGGLASELAICRSVRDAAAIFRTCAGETRGPFPPPAFISPTEAGLRIGLLTQTGASMPTDPERSNAVEAAARALERLGHRLVPIDFQALEPAVLASGRVFAGMVSINLAEFASRADLDLSGAESMTRSVVARGRAMSAMEVWTLTREMVFVARDLWQIFEDIDCLLTPMLATAPKPLGAFPTDHDDCDQHFERMLAFAPLAPLANVSGCPAITLAFGEDVSGLPLPVQILAPMGGEPLLLALAARLEAEGRWQHRFPVAGYEA